MTDRHAAAEILLAEISTLARTQKQAEDRLASLRAEREELTGALQALLRREPEETRRSFLNRLAHEESRLRPRGRRLGRTPMSQCALRHLIERRHPRIRAADLLYHLENYGFSPSRRQVSDMLSHWCSRGMLHRTGHGVYTINTNHMDLIDLALDILQEKVKGM